MRRAVLIVLLCAFLAGCGAEGTVSPLPQTVVGKLPKAKTFPIVAAFKLKGDPTAGAAVYKGSGCGACHTLSAAHSTGTVGPNLDTLKPDYRASTAQVTNGGSAMPPFKGQLSDQKIADVAAYVVKSTGGTVP